MPQYGHLPTPVDATSMNTRGWLLQSGISGFGQNTTPGPCNSAASSSTTALYESPVAMSSIPCQTLVSHSAYLGLRPLTMSKNAVWIFSVIGPREPAPSSMRSSSRIGVTSAAVPVKKASSQM